MDSTTSSSPYTDPLTPPHPTHHLLRASYKRLDAIHARTLFSPLSPTETTLLLRKREVLHFGIALCDAHICSSEAIESLVNTRLEAIEQETSPFVPNVLETEEHMKTPDTRMVEWMTDVGVERLEDLAKAREEELSWEVRHVVYTPPGQISEEEEEEGQERSEEEDMQEPLRDDEFHALFPPTPPGGWIPPPTPRPRHTDLVFDTDLHEDGWETDSNQSISSSIDETLDLEQAHASGRTTKKPPRIPVFEDHTASPPAIKLRRRVEPRTSMPSFSPDPVPEESGSRSSSSPLAPTSFAEVHEDLTETLSGIEDTFGTQIVSFEHQKMVEALRDGIQQAQHPPAWLTPKKLWSDVEESVRRSAVREMERRDLLDQEAEKGSNSLNEEARQGEESSSPLELARQRAYAALASSEAVVDRLVAEVEAEEQDDVSTPSSPLNRRSPVPGTEGQERIYTFIPVLHGNAPLSAAHAEIRTVYRRTVQYTLEALLNNSDSDEVHELARRYWDFVEREVPGMEAEEDEHEEEGDGEIDADTSGEEEGYREEDMDRDVEGRLGGEKEL